MPTKPRRQLYLDPDLDERLDVLATRSGTSKSAILATALRAYLDRRGAKELDDLLGTRLNRLGRGQDVIMESLALFIRYYLTITAPVPDADKAALAIGQDRFQAFINQVARRMASGRGFAQDLATQTAHQEAAE